MGDAMSDHPSVGVPKPVLAYLTSAYARAADTFIRGEVKQLRALGFTVHTFSVRRSEAREMVSDEVRHEQANTDYILDGGRMKLFRALAAELMTHPLRLFKALALGQRCSPPGLKPRVWHVAYVIEAVYLARQLRRKNIKHLHNHIGENSATIAMLAGALTGIPFSMTVHGPDEFDHPRGIALGEKIRRAAFVVAISSFGRSQLWRWCGRESWDKIRIVHCGVDENYLTHSPTPVPDRPRLVSIGRLSQAKGQLVLIEAAALLNREQIEFEIVLVGDGPMRAALEEAILRHGLTHKVRLAGWKDAQEIRNALIESRALIMPSFAEGLPVVIMEALALGRPVVSTTIAGIPELVQDQINGFLVPAGSVSALARAVKRVLATPTAELNEMGRRGAAAVAREHDASRETSKLAAFFTAIAVHGALPAQDGDDVR
jgi:glycosyltransferase involved in cell wall biosynthesis